MRMSQKWSILFVLSTGLLVVGSTFISPLWVAAGKVAYPCLFRSLEERTECYEDTLPDLFPEFSVREIFSFVKSAQKIEPALADCHFVAHELGQRVVRNNPKRLADFIKEEIPGSICAG